MRKKVIHKDYNSIENVDFDMLNEILEEKGVPKSELSRKCGYYDGYITKHVFGEKRLNQTVANTLEKVYGVSTNEYTYKKEEESTSNDDMYEFTIKINGKLLKELALKSVINHISIEDFVLNCVLNEIGERAKE